MRPRRRRTDPDKVDWTFAALVLVTLGLEVVVLLWLTGAIRPLSATG